MIINTVALALAGLLSIISLIASIILIINAWINEDSDFFKIGTITIIFSLLMWFFFATALVNDSNYTTMNGALEAAVANTISVERIETVE